MNDMTSRPTIKSLFQDSGVICLAPNELSLAQIRRALFEEEPPNSSNVRLESFNSLETALAAELRPPEADELARLFILNSLARPLAETLSQTPAINLTDISCAELRKLAENLGDAFDRLKLARLSWDKVAELPPEGLGVALAELGRRHDQLMLGMGRVDRFARRRQVLEELENGHPFRALKGVGEIICRWSQRLSPFETDFIIALAHHLRVKLCLRVPAWARDGNIDHGSGFDLLRSINQLEKSGLSNIDLEFEALDEGLAPPPLAYAAENLLAPPSYRKDTPPAPEGRLRLLTAPTAYHEVQEAARRLKELMVQGLRPDDLALVVPDVDKYSPLIDDMARRFNLAFHFRRGRPLSEYGPVRAALDIIELWGSNWERSRLTELLRSPYFMFDGLEATEGSDKGLDLAFINRLTIKSGMSDRRAGGDFRLLSKIRSRRAEKILDIFIKLEESGARAAGAQSWPELIGAFTGVLNELLWPGPLDKAPLNVWGGDLSAALAFKDELEKFSASLAESPCPPEVSLENFRLWLENLLEEKRLTWDADPEGRVRVINYYDLHGGIFEEIFFLGLNERVFPRIGTESRWWPESFTTAASRLLGRPLWSDENDNYRQQELLLACGLAQAKKRVWLFHHLGDDMGRELLPSPLVAALRELWNDENGESLLKIEEVGGQNTSLENAAGTDELFLALTRLKKELWPKELASEPALISLADDLRSRWRRWQALKKEAAPGPAAIKSWLAKLPDEKGWPLVTPSFPAAFASCPLAFWAKAALNLTDDGQEIDEWPRSGEGNLLHAVLEQFFRPRLGSALWPGEEKYEDCQAELLEILEEESARHAKQYPLGRLPLWELRREEIKESLKAWLRREIDGENTRPLAVEWAFGLGENTAEPLKFPFPGSREGLYFKGRVDRIDLGDQGLSVRDYKLNERVSLRVGKDKNGRPRVSPDIWPILIYSLAAARDFGQDAEGVFEVLNPAAKKHRIATLATNQAEMTFDGASNQAEEQDESFNLYQEMAKTWEDLSQGVFKPQEERGRCSWCPFSLFCPQGDDAHDEGEE